VTALVTQAVGLQLTGAASVAIDVSQSPATVLTRAQFAHCNISNPGSTLIAFTNSSGSTLQAASVDAPFPPLLPPGATPTRGCVLSVSKHTTQLTISGSSFSCGPACTAQSSGPAVLVTSSAASLVSSSLTGWASGMGALLVSGAGAAVSLVGGEVRGNVWGTGGGGGGAITLLASTSAEIQSVAFADNSPADVYAPNPASLPACSYLTRSSSTSMPAACVLITPAPTLAPPLPPRTPVSVYVGYALGALVAVLLMYISRKRVRRAWRALSGWRERWRRDRIAGQQLEALIAIHGVSDPEVLGAVQDMLVSRAPEVGAWWGGPDDTLEAAEGVGGRGVTNCVLWMRPWVCAWSCCRVPSGGSC
jgi:hypothetical protein